MFNNERVSMYRGYFVMKMRIFESTLFITFVICKVIADDDCKGRNGIKKCCVNYWMVNGTCQECPAGLYGLDCSAVCPYGYFGIKCVKKCNCSDGFVCSPETGCEMSGCGLPSRKDNTEITYSSSAYGSKALYLCSKGFDQYGPNTITCLNNGSWEVPSIICIPKDCGSPSKKDNTELIHFSSTYGSEAVYKCNKGFNQLGNNTITCLHNGSWEMSSIICIPKGDEYRKKTSSLLGSAVVLFFMILIAILVCFPV